MIDFVASAAMVTLQLQCNAVYMKNRCYLAWTLLLLLLLHQDHDEGAKGQIQIPRIYFTVLVQL
jgi:hypothetical protein